MAVLIAGAAFSFYHLASDLFACGRDLAGWEARGWLALAAVQGLLFLLGAQSQPARRAYGLLQALTAPVVVVALAQLAFAYPRTFVAIALFGGAYWLAVALPAMLRGRAPSFAHGPGAFAAETTLFLLSLLIVHTAVAFLFLHRPDTRLDDRTFWIIAAGSGALCAWLVRREAPKGPLPVGELPPLALLAIVLLRAKLPDGTYDALLYKATVPILIADWRTAVTGVLDHTMLATNLGEIMAAQLRILDPAYPPALGSSLAFLALWAIAPMAARGLFGEGFGPGRDFGRRAAVLVAVSITEPLLAAGTSYQEPLLSLLMVAFLLPMSAGWLFLSAAVATKATALFVAPVLVALRFSSGADRARPSLVLGLYLVLAALVAGEQLQRNLSDTGRVFAGSYILSSVTDPHNEVLAAYPKSPEGSVPGPSLPERVGLTLLHVLTLDLWWPVTELDFHVLPSSRFIPVAMVLGLCAFALPALRRSRGALVPLALWAACAFAMLAVVTQGRHLAPLSLAAALVVARALASWCNDDEARPMRGAWFAAALALAACGDQAVGTFINDGWECRRSLLARVVVDSPDRPDSDLERRLAELVAGHRAKAPPGGLPPSVVCEGETERKRYLGTHHIYTYLSTELLPRYVAADPRRAARVPTSVLAVCFLTDAFADRMLAAGARASYDEVPGVGPVRILVSRPLRDGARATSLYAPEGAGPSASGDLLARWEGGLVDEARADTPTGRGSFVAQVEGARVAVILSPHRVAFDALLRGDDALVLELAMPFAGSDGMALEVSLEDAKGARHATTLDLTPRHAPGLGWETRRINIPAAFAGRSRLTLTASSPSGDMSADWVYLRKAAIEPKR